MTTMRAVVKYAVDASDAEKELALWMGIDDVIYELICERGMRVIDVEDRCMEAIANALDERDTAS